MNLIDQLQLEQEKESVPELRTGDTVRVHAKVVEGTRERIQVFEGTVLRVTNGGLRRNFTVRRVTHGVGVERTFLVHSPRIDKIEVLRHGQVRQARLYYLRDKIGKEGRIKERRAKVAGPPPAPKGATAEAPAAARAVAKPAAKSEAKPAAKASKTATKAPAKK